MKLLLLPALLMACVPLAAQDVAEVKVGDPAPEIQATNWINPPTWSSMSELHGDVVMIKAWGKN